MNPEEIIASESSRLGRPLTAAEKAEIRGGATRIEETTGPDGIRSTSIVTETPAERTARAARESRSVGGADLNPVEDWISNAPSRLREAIPTLSEWAGRDEETFSRRITVIRNAGELLTRALEAPEMQPRDQHAGGALLEITRRQAEEVFEHLSTQHRIDAVAGMQHEVLANPAHASAEGHGEEQGNGDHDHRDN